MPLLAQSLLVFAARALSASLTTLRGLLGLRRQKHLAALSAFFESLIFLLVISQVLQDARSPATILSYCGGFAAGTLLGLVIEERAGMGYALVSATTLDGGRRIAHALRSAGYGVTEMQGLGQLGSVQMVSTVVRRRAVRAVIALVSATDAAAFITVGDAHQVLGRRLGPAR
jgi:uncharacterized protein YebE (UPF0316 family)